MNAHMQHEFSIAGLKPTNKYLVPMTSIIVMSINSSPVRVTTIVFSNNLQPWQVSIVVDSTTTCCHLFEAR